jgi:hypothetical protein
MRSALLSLVEAMPSNLPVLWLSTMELSTAEDRIREQSGMVVHEDEKLISLIAWLNNSSDNLTFKSRLPLSNCSRHTVLLTRTAEEDRREVFKQFFDTLPMLPNRLYAARMQVIKAKIQIRKPAVIASEAVLDVTVTQASKGPSRSLRSGLSCKDDKDKDTTSAPTQQPIMMTEDGDKQCVRELRNFLRATLGELHKEKKCLVFWRPVDPESVPDYYDVISCPMDLETMRMKVNSTYLRFSLVEHGDESMPVLDPSSLKCPNSCNDTVTDLRQWDDTPLCACVWASLPVIFNCLHSSNYFLSISLLFS